MTHRTRTIMTHSSRLLAALLASTGVATAHAHEGHGLDAFSHWHATDAVGFVAVMAVVAGLVWWRGRK
jgi:hypothetical protein